MFSNNRRISLRQLKRMMVMELIGITGLVIPGITVGAAGRDGVLAMAVGLVFVTLYVLLLCRLGRRIDGEYMQYARKRCGLIGMDIIGAFYLVQLLFSGAFASRLLGEVVRQVLLPDTSVQIIMIVLLVLAVYAAAGGMEGRARMTEILYWLVLGPVIIMLLFTAKDLDFDNLAPIFVSTVPKVAAGGYGVLIFFSILGMMLFVIPFMKRDARIYRTTMHGAVIVGLFHLVFILLVVSAFGVGGTYAKNWPIISLMTIVRTPLNVLGRFDSILIVIWLVSIFTFVNSCIFYSSLVSRQLIGNEKMHIYLIPFAAVILLLASWADNYQSIYQTYMSYMKYIGMPAAIAIPVLLLFLDWMQGRRKEAKE